MNGHMKALGRTYREAMDRIGKAYDMNELLLYFRVFVPVLVACETHGAAEPAGSPLRESDLETMQRLSGIAAAGTIYHTDLEFVQGCLRTLSKRLEDLAQFLELFLVSVRQLADVTPPES